MTELMPNLCEHLENTSAFFQVSGKEREGGREGREREGGEGEGVIILSLFQTQMAENDGVMDVGGSGSQYPQFCLCFHLLLKSLCSFFGW